MILGSLESRQRNFRTILRINRSNFKILPLKQKIYTFNDNPSKFREKIQFKDILLREINYIQHQAFIIIFSMYNSENYLRIRTKPDDYNNRTIHPRSIFPFSARSSSPWERNVEIKVRGADVAALREGAASPPAAAAAAADTRCDHMSRRGRTVCARRFRKSHGHRVIRRLNAS